MVYVLYLTKDLKKAKNTKLYCLQNVIFFLLVVHNKTKKLNKACWTGNVSKQKQEEASSDEVKNKQKTSV